MNSLIAAPTTCQLCGVPRSSSANSQLYLACPSCTFVNELSSGAVTKSCDVCGRQLQLESADLGFRRAFETASELEKSPATSYIPCPACTYLNSTMTSKCDMCGTNLEHLNTSADQTGTRESSFGPLSQSPTSPMDARYSTSATEIKLSFRGSRGGGQARFLEQLRSAVAARAWDKPKSGADRLPQTPLSFPRSSISSAQSLPAQAVAQTSTPGISGIIRTIDRQKLETVATMDRAFQDLDTLMHEASGMVRLAEQISARLSNDEANAESREAVAFRTYLVELGIPNPVTKESAGDVFHNELARQLADFLVPVLSSSTSLGVMSLVDAYALYNRARGVSLISPDDLRRSAGLFKSLGIPLHLKTFDSGLVVVESDDVSQERISERVWSITSSKTRGITAFGLAASLGISVALAGEWLLMTEQTGLVSRDETVEGLRFYDNLIRFWGMPDVYRIL